MARVFISYSHGDAVVARLFAKRLTEAGLKVWLDEEQIEPGADIATSIRAGFDQSDTILLLIGKGNAHGDSWARREAALALSKPDKRLIPVVVDRSADTPFLLRNIKALDATDLERAEQAANRIARFLSSSGKDVQANDSVARADAALALSRELQLESEEYHRGRAFANTSLLANVGSHSLAVLLAGVVVVLLKNLFASDGEVHGYIYLLVGVFAGLLGSFFASRLGGFLIRREMNKTREKP